MFPNLKREHAAVETAHAAHLDAALHSTLNNGAAQRGSGIG